ncbi:MAG: hypothetical protein WBP93_09480, partial [Pyrinomonadaceae bacterium]
GTGRQGREAQADAILDLVKGIDPRVLATSADPVLRAARFAAIDANRTKAESFEENTREAIARAQAGARIQQDAREQLKLLQASNLPQDETVKRFLAITSTLSDKELVGDLRLGREKALDVAAQQEAAKERQAEERGKRIDDVMKKLDQALSDKGLKLDQTDSPDKKLTLEVIRRDDNFDINATLDVAPRAMAGAFGGDNHGGDNQ